MTRPLASALVAAIALACAGCDSANSSTTAEPAKAADKPALGSQRATDAGAGEVNMATLVLDPENPANSRIVGTAALGGLEMFGLDGKRRATTPAGEAAAVDVGYGLRINGVPSTVVAAVDTTTNSLRLYTMAGDTLTEAGARELPLGFAGEGVCLHHSPIDDGLYAFIVGDGGEVEQQLLFATSEGKLDARQVRRISVPSPLKQCVVSRDGQVYASEETVGIWRGIL